MRWTLAAAAAVLGAFALLAGSPYLEHHDRVDAETLATWIKDRKPGLHVVDVRSQTEFDAYHIPTSHRIAPESLSSNSFSPTDTVVLVSEGAVLPQGRDYHVYFLRGGVQAWRDKVLAPKQATPLSRYFGGARRRGC
jgi:rhodanese-related sulfurtransferase